MDKTAAFCTAFIEYFIHEEVEQDMIETVADAVEVPYEEARAFCKRNLDLLGKAYAEAWKVVERIAKEAK